MAGNGASTFLEVTLSFSGINPNVPDNEGNAPLHFAAQAGNYVYYNNFFYNTITRYNFIIIFYFTR